MHRGVGRNTQEGLGSRATHGQKHKNTTHAQDAHIEVVPTKKVFNGCMVGVHNEFSVLPGLSTQDIDQAEQFLADWLTMPTKINLF